MKNDKSRALLLFSAGVAFAFLWASAAAATKLGLKSAQPFVICVARFFLAGVIMLFISHGILRKRLPSGKEWKQLAIYGFLNIALYLGLYVVAMQNVSAGLSSMSIATNPVLISLISALLFRQRIKAATWISLLLCSLGVLIAAYPLLQSSFATPTGLIILFCSMLSYSIGVLYFSKQQWNDLDVITINGWQTLLGGIFILPFAAFTYDSSLNHFDLRFTGSILWLAIPVSIVAVQIWLFLLRDNPVKASFWLFLCPVFGYLIANVVMQEPISVYTVTGLALVIGGLYLVQRAKKG
ncbi:EamA family transporter [Pseudoflavitalea sp. G-6-1-2]|nr:EamA family transporter [Pseudoflavitalea sp. G-6-1-2]